MSWLRKIEILRSIDSVIDFSRATAQLRILIALDDRKLSVSEIVELTGLRRKTILDALRKLEIKGLVARADDKFMLTEQGRAIYSALRSIVQGEEESEYFTEVRAIGAKPALYDVYNELLSVVYMLKVLEILGSRKKRSMPLDSLASKLGVSPPTLDSHLQRFTAPDIPIFSRVRESGRGERIVYLLTDLGYDLYIKLFPKRGPLQRAKHLIHRMLTLISGS